ncbi:MAG: formamidopyrimidine-DNA glycosylase, partial [Firmicutes bacterium]|nr:formamidopyrimidine-DNA glycosylase [Bacillota bacterium]
MRRTLAAEIPGRRIEQVEVFLPKVARPGSEELAEGLKGKRFRLPGRRGKYLILPLEPGGVLVVHLR